MDRWVFVTKDLSCWKDLAENRKKEFCVNKHVKNNDMILIYRTGNHRDIKYLFEVISSIKFYGKYQIVLEKRETFKNSLKLSEMKNDPLISNWRRKFVKGFIEVDFDSWNRIIELISDKNPKLFKEHSPKCCSGPHLDGYPLNYKKSFFKLLDKIRKCKNKDSFNEETTKQLIIIPILQKMGWNTYDVCEVHPEHAVHHHSRKVDYILRDHESNQVCIEAKKVGETDFDFHEEQLLRYCAFKHADIGILTNGINWRFYRIQYTSKDLGAINTLLMKEISLKDNNNYEIFDTFIKYLWKGKISKKKRAPLSIPSFETILEIIRNMRPDDRLKYNEEAMKQGIISPLLNNLGWNMSDPSEIQFEKQIKVPNDKPHKIDYILGKSPDDIIVEVKGLGEDLSDINKLDKHEEHLLDYMESGKYDFGVITNAIIWKFCLMNEDEDYIKCRKINIKDENGQKESLKSLLSKKDVLNGKHIVHLKKLN